MRRRLVVCVSLVALAGVAGFAEEKKNDLQTANLNLIQRAESAAVVIFPETSNPVYDPSANRNAQGDVEQAIRKWGRFRLGLLPQDADIVIAIRKGNARATTPTIGGRQVNDRPVILQPSDAGIRIGVQHGTPPPVTRDGNSNPEPEKPQIGMGSGTTDDVFEVYTGKQTYPLDSAPLWRYQSKDTLKAPKVKAVEAFRKALEEADKKKP